MEIVEVKGKKGPDILLYALSTCGWCRKTKEFLNQAGVTYRFVDVDLAAGAEKERLMEEVTRWNPDCSFPTVVIDGKSCMVGFQPERLAQVLAQ